MFTLMAQVMAQNVYIQALTVQADYLEIDFAIGRLEGLFQQLMMINPTNLRLASIWAMLDQYTRNGLNELRLSVVNEDKEFQEDTFMALQEKISYTVALLSWV
ncbi:hypothetical protein EXU85_13630 [Spirosoma sp. KCTC 42546]|uniref:hypothetical protein n=1 Tax=Spirosoma sp. KCTC 42546 TaxID=2520506 RepID=UPI00115A0228|nr:hypothetical protein [Spirosoma sp. KCTC 42546]QDK79586.1 hypothetical protein EXU85_13630 [Spirosoma sp. KCTC 42546]